jgi:hypothetical protein
MMMMMMKIKMKMKMKMKMIIIIKGLFINKKYRFCAPFFLSQHDSWYHDTARGSPQQ